jgi:hypothetical protein
MDLRLGEKSAISIQSCSQNPLKYIHRSMFISARLRDDGAIRTGKTAGNRFKGE